MKKTVVALATVATFAASVYFFNVSWRVTEEPVGPRLLSHRGVHQTLDVGSGYTADDGETFSLRGKGIGLMPELGEVFA